MILKNPPPKLGGGFCLGTGYLPFTIFVLQPMNKQKRMPDDVLITMRDLCCHNLHSNYGTVMDGNVVVVYKPHHVTETNIKKIIAYAETIDARIGISWTFSGKRNIRRHHRQAIFAVEKANKMQLPGRIVYYDDVYILDILGNCDRREYWVESVPPSLKAVMDYDEKNDSHLLETLFYFLKNGMNLTSTSSDMNIHKSTLFHRIELIKELIPDMSSKNIGWQTSIMLALDILRHEGKLTDDKRDAQ